MKNHATKIINAKPTLSNIIIIQPFRYLRNEKIRSKRPKLDLRCSEQYDRCKREHSVTCAFTNYCRDTSWRASKFYFFKGLLSKPYNDHINSAKGNEQEDGLVE